MDAQVAQIVAQSEAIMQIADLLMIVAGACGVVVVLLLLSGGTVRHL